jgi:uncharacterized protein YhaN
MKRRIRAILKPIWRMTQPLRQPLSARLTAHVTRGVQEPLRGVYEHLEVANAALQRMEHPQGTIRTIEREIQISRAHSGALASDANLLLDSLVRELARLQRQIEALQQSVDELTDRHQGLGIVGAFESQGEPRAKVG